MIGLGWVHHASYLVTVFVEKKAKKGEPKSAVSQTLEFLGARNWTKVASSDRRIFSREGIVQERSILGSCHVMTCVHANMRTKKKQKKSDSSNGIANVKHQENTKKRRTTKSAVTPTHNVFRRSKLDTVASLARRIFLSEGVVFFDGPKHTHLHVSASLARLSL